MKLRPSCLLLLKLDEVIKNSGMVCQNKEHSDVDHQKAKGTYLRLDHHSLKQPKDEH